MMQTAGVPLANWNWRAKFRLSEFTVEKLCRLALTLLVISLVLSVAALLLSVEQRALHDLSKHLTVR